MFQPQDQHKHELTEKFHLLVFAAKFLIHFLKSRIERLVIDSGSFNENNFSEVILEEAEGFKYQIVRFTRCKD
ncbi:Hypothetical predicted protein [Octopus vulgaris]|uniref:Uncharacterized protein n=1 Tax=Octopus vulgaris TaxID=6645 RepID=A0AA36BD89_OCTVU|nr:Hypothetical predicted protein [Octopus vulgaris]